MSGTTVSGGTIHDNFTGASGAAALFSAAFGAVTSVTVLSDGGNSTVPGAVALLTSEPAVTVSGSAVADLSPGNNDITTINPAVVFAAPNDTITSAAATTLFGASGGGVDDISLSGANSSVTGGTGSIVGTVSGGNSTLVGGTGISIFSVTGPNSLAVAGSSGTTGFNEEASTGPETIATNPLGNSGTLIAILGSGADTVLGGSGASTITAGTGSDVFAFIKGHAGGSEVIIGFNGSDNLAFAGYGYTAADLPSEAIGSTGDVITLSDGTTITLAGFDHKIF